MLNKNKVWQKLNKKKRRIDSDTKTLINLITEIKIISDYKIKLKINEISDKINNETLIKISVEIHVKIHDKTHDKALNMIKADQKNIFLIKNLNTV